jgi:hypothetical protein
LSLSELATPPGAPFGEQSSSSKVAPSRSLEVLLEFKEESKGASGVATSVSTGSLHDGDLETGMSFGFELTLPEDAFPIYRSEHGELYWQLDVKSDSFGSDVHERRRVEVEPLQRTAPG